MPHKIIAWIVALGVVGCGGGGGEAPGRDPGQRDPGVTDRGEVPVPDVSPEAEVLDLPETEVVDICAQLNCAEMYKVFPSPGEQVCFRWTCDPAREQCVIEFLQNVACDDGLACTRMDTCRDGQCVGTVDECECQGDEGACSDGNPCTVGDFCKAGKCVAGQPKDCSEYQAQAGECRKMECWFGVCMWVPLPEGEICTSPNPCFLRGRCDGRGTCVEDLQSQRNCNDGNPCTSDLCDPAHSGADPKTGCYHEFNEDPCDDQDACTEQDRCQAGVCKGTPVACDDENPCTQDTCEPKAGCQYQSLPDESPCDDGNECTPKSWCSKGLCVGEVNCDDQDQCTDDYCDLLEKRCKHVRHTRSCNDGNPCTTADRCGEDGQCRGTPVICPSNACNDGACEVIAGKGVCTMKPKAVGSPCDDGNGCTTDDACSAPGPDGTATCKGQAVTCAEKADDCNEGVCIPVDPQTYVCVANPKVGKPPCEDKDLCTVGDYCQYGKCVAGAPKVCEPAVDACEQNLCDKATGECVLSLKPGTCNDGNACTVGDVCVAGTSPEDGPGKCVGTLIVCNDQNVCTLDSCDPQVGCRFIPRIKECSNETGRACVTDADCEGGGKCLEVTCADDGNPCTRDVCTADGTCKHVGRFKECQDGRPCASDAECGMDGPCGPVPCADDGLECTVDLCWWDGTCRHFQRLRACPDGVPCLADSECGGAPGSCQEVGPVPCDDRDKCTLDDRCTLEGACKGTPRDCTDYETLPSGVEVKNVCTDDFCDQNNPLADPATGCYYVFNSNPCEDHDPCTRAEKCAGSLCDVCFFGHCTGPILRDCDDKNPCTLDGCDQFHPGADGSGCWHENLPQGTICDDLNQCTHNDQCDGQAHCGGSAVDCDDKNECTIEVGCDPAIGCLRRYAENGTTCNDANACTLGDRCFAGVCSGPNQVNCNDNNPCTVDWCLPTEGCQHEGYACDDGLGCTSDTCKGDGTCQFALKPGWCVIDGVCWQSGTLNPDNDCQYCNPSLSPNAWSNLPSGAACADDGVGCTVDQCNGLGTCTHPIASDSCRIGEVCYAREALNPANDCQACNPSQSQTLWSNLPSGAPCADDGDWCTVDQCNGLGTCVHPTKPDSCRIAGLCYERGDLNPGNDCQECNPALSQTTWSARASGAGCADDGIPCTLDQCNGLGACVHPIRSSSCLIAGVCYDAGAVALPPNDCQECNPALSQTTWSYRGSGAPCQDDGDWCTLDQCDGFGTCTHPTATETCKIQGVCYAAGVANPANDCQECNPALSKTSWSNRASGTACGDDGVSCTLDQCNGLGACVHPIAPDFCRISGTCYARNDTRPGNDCQACNPSQNQTGWSNLPSGAPCGDDDDPCTVDQCNGFGVCQHPLAPDKCRIDGVCYASGETNPSNPCQVCNPSQSQVSWSNKASGTSCTDDGLTCTSDVCNAEGQCTHPIKAGFCLIEGQCRSSGTQNPANQCEECNPALNPNAWSAKANGTLCSDGNACTITDVCFMGACQPGSPKVCTALDQCHVAGTCDPETGVCSNPTKDDGTPCNDNNQCTVGESCQDGECTGGTPVVCNDGNPCTQDLCAVGTGCYYPPKQDGTDCSSECAQNATCQGGQCQGTLTPYGMPCTPDTHSCTDDICNGSGACIHPIQAGKCLIGGTCYNDGAQNPANDCEACIASQSQTQWSNRPSGSQCADDGTTCTDDQCNGSGACIHPIQAGKCLIGGTCYDDGAQNPANDCEACIASQSQTQWSNRPSGSQCADDGTTCTDDQCNGSGACIHPIQAGKCLIGGTCYDDGAQNPANDCEACIASQSQTQWSNRPNGTQCGGGKVCCNGVCQASCP